MSHKMKRRLIYAVIILALVVIILPIPFSRHRTVNLPNAKAIPHKPAELKSVVENPQNVSQNFHPQGPVLPETPINTLKARLKVKDLSAVHVSTSAVTRSTIDKTKPRMLDLDKTPQPSKTDKKIVKKAAPIVAKKPADASPVFTRKIPHPVLVAEKPTQLHHKKKPALVSDQSPIVQRFSSPQLKNAVVIQIGRAHV